MIGHTNNQIEMNLFKTSLGTHLCMKLNVSFKKSTYSTLNFSTKLKNIFVVLLSSPVPLKTWGKSVKGSWVWSAIETNKQRLIFYIDKHLLLDFSSIGPTFFIVTHDPREGLCFVEIQKFCLEKEGLLKIQWESF